MSLPLIIPPEQEPAWRALLATRGAYWRLYAFIADQLHGAAGSARGGASDTEIHDTRVWFESAAAINDPHSRRFIHFFARAYLCAEAYRQTMIAIEPWGVAVQGNSDALGERIRQQILDAGAGAIPSFATIGPIDTRAITEKLIPGRRLARTVWPAYAQWAWIHAHRHLGWRAHGFVPWLRDHLFDLISPTETFDDVSFMDDLSAREKRVIVQIAAFCARYARLCQAAGDWDRDFLSLLRRDLAPGGSRRALAPML